MSLTLIGYRATGKTTVARLLAERLGWDWIDADVEIERRAGKSIASIFAEDGEPAFRDLEVAVTADLCQRPRLVLAAGGGAPMRAENRQAMRRGGTVVWLKALPETIHRRMSGDATTAGRRPDLTDQGGLAEIVELLARREPIYQETADFAVDTEGKTPDANRRRNPRSPPHVPRRRGPRVNLILTIPLEFRLAALFVLGTVLGSLANLGTYRLAWHARPISPWSRPDPDPKTPPRHWTDRVPIFGWLGLRREASLHGAGFWIRPLLVELLAGFGLAWLYWWEIDRLGLLARVDAPARAGCVDDDAPRPVRRPRAADLADAGRLADRRRREDDSRRDHGVRHARRAGGGGGLSAVAVARSGHRRHGPSTATSGKSSRRTRGR